MNGQTGTTTCPDCGGKVSIRAYVCPHCGAPLGQPEGMYPDPKNPGPMSYSQGRDWAPNDPQANWNKPAVVGFTMALAYLPFSWVTTNLLEVSSPIVPSTLQLLYWVAFFTLGIVGLKGTRSKRQRGWGLALTTLILASMYLLLAIAAAIAFFALML